MGFYVNPPDGRSKETFLIGHGVVVPGRTMKWEEVPKGSLPVVLVRNAHFTAACIAFDERELKECTQPDDDRPRTIYLVSIEDLLDVDEEFRIWWRHHRREDSVA